MITTLIRYVAILVALQVTVAAQEQQWEKKFGGGEAEEGMMAIQTRDGGYAVVGTTMSYKGGPKAITSIYLLKTDADGTVLWEKPIGDKYYQYPRAIFETSAGYTIIGQVQDNTTTPATGRDVYFVMVDRGGGISSEKVYGGPAEESTLCAIGTTDGGYMVSVDSSFNASFFKLDSAGNLQWHKSYPSVRRGLAIEQTRDGGYIVTGDAEDPPAVKFDVPLFRMNASGDSLWYRVLGMAANERGYGVHELTTGGFVIAGTSDKINDDDVMILRTDADGFIESSVVVQAFDEDNFVEGFERSRDGGYLIVGSTEQSGVRSKVHLLKLDATGKFQWEKRFGVASDESREGKSVRETTDGGYIVAGTFKRLQAQQVILLKIMAPPAGIGEWLHLPTVLNLW